MNRNDTWFTELWENRNYENFRESFKEDSRIYPNTVVDIVNLVEGNNFDGWTIFDRAYSLISLL